jgi:signal transduction histidine kinase
VAVTPSGASLEQLAREHAALRRVATLVASEPPPDEVFTAVAREAGLLLGAQRGTLLRVVNPQWAEVVASWSDGMAPALPVGHCAAIEEGRGLLGQMLQTARPVRIEDFDEVGGVVAALMRELGVRSGVGGPIVIGGRVWGAVTAAWPGEGPPPIGAEDRLAAFAVLVAHAVQNAQTRNELAASRARLVEASDEARRRIERDLHDGAQQRLVVTALELSMLERKLDQAPEAARAMLARAREQLACGLSELRDLARGIHPTVLTERGLEAAVTDLAQRAPLPVDLRVAVPDRLDPTIEAAAYFLVSEALTNVAKYAHAERVSVDIAATDGAVEVTIADDGAGGADAAKGSGLRGLIDRVTALGGRMDVSSPPGRGTRLSARLPVNVLATVHAQAATLP